MWLLSLFQILSPIGLLLALLITRWLGRSEERSASREMTAAITAALAVSLAYHTRTTHALWVCLATVLDGPLHFLNLSWLLDNASQGMSRLLRGGFDVLWPLRTAMIALPAMILALVVATATRPYISPAVQQRVLNKMPQWVRPFGTNRWPEDRTALKQNMMVLMLCLVPLFLIGVVAAIYLRLKRPDSLWPITWVAAMLALGALGRFVVGWAAFPLLRAAGASSLPLSLVILAIVPLIISTSLLMVTMPSAAPSVGSQRAFRLLLLFYVPVFLFVAGWLLMIIVS